MIRQYRKLTYPVDAIQYTTGNLNEIVDWVESNGGKILFKPRGYAIVTYERDAYFVAGDYIVRDRRGEFYPCPRGYFELHYVMEDASHEPDIQCGGPYGRSIAYLTKEPLRGVYSDVPNDPRGPLRHDVDQGPCECGAWH